MANACKESGAWLNAFPFSTLGTRLENNFFRIAISLRMGIPVCVSHTCVCGQQVDEFGYHGLYCNKIAMVNDLMKRSLVAISFSEPIGCNRRDGKTRMG